ncbi:hypothetical protein BDU57DRAFT_596028 [Ampelomyces quisqualis]|uniref:Uncharacterized protein n=1 Tax=Ampelomyces quisqualis TaxID=50730 RepID=A0A6A5QLJ6_AMPQU|nr:hypothetical protein BDU57DRAFT_596028 [Ampelomyces quisqualis]
MSAPIPPPPADIDLMIKVAVDRAVAETRRDTIELLRKILRIPGEVTPTLDSTTTSSSSVSTATLPQPAATTGHESVAAAAPTSVAITAPIPVGDVAQIRHGHASGQVTTISTLNRKRKADPDLDIPLSTAAPDALPKCFQLLGSALQDELREKFQEKIEMCITAAERFPWLSQFSLKSFNKAALAKEFLQRRFSVFTNGKDPMFQKEFRKFEHYLASCMVSPSVWNIRHWLSEFALPLAIAEYCKALKPIPLPGYLARNLPGSERNDALHKIFAALAKAYLRMVLVYAQRSEAGISLSKDDANARNLPDNVRISWEDLVDRAQVIEHGQATNATSQPFGQVMPFYATEVNSAIVLLKEKYLVLDRYRATCIANTPGGIAAMHPRWHSFHAYITHIHTQKKIVADDGITQLVHAKKRKELGDLSGLDIDRSYKSTTNIPDGERKTGLGQLLLLLRIADDDWAAIHNISILHQQNNPDLAFKAIAQKLESKIVKLADETNLSQDPATREKASKTYARKLKAFRSKLIDSPIDALKSFVREIMGSEAPPNLWIAEDFGPGCSPKYAPTECPGFMPASHYNLGLRQAKCPKYRGTMYFEDLDSKVREKLNETPRWLFGGGEEGEYEYGDKEMVDG